MSSKSTRLYSSMEMYGISCMEIFMKYQYFSIWEKINFHIEMCQSNKKDG